MRYVATGLLLMLGAGSAFAAVGVWLGPGVGSAYTTGYTGYSDEDVARSGFLLGFGAGWENPRFTVRGFYAVESGADITHEPYTGEFSLLIESDETTSAETNTDLAVGYKLPGSAVTLVPGLAVNWNRAYYEDNWSREVENTIGHYKDVEDKDAIVHDWLVTPTFGVCNTIGILSWSAGVGVGYLSHRETGGRHELYYDYVAGERSDATAEVKLTSGGLGARVDGGAAFQFGRFFRLGANVGVRSALSDIDKPNGTTGKKRMDVTVAVTPAFSF